MANFPVDLSPFVPGHFEILEVPHRPQQCRYHVASPVFAKPKTSPSPPSLQAPC
jgi:hypothetical protein